MSSVEQSLSIDQTVPLSDGIQEGAENQINAEVILRIWQAFHPPPLSLVYLDFSGYDQFCFYLFVICNTMRWTEMVMMMINRRSR